MIANVSSAPVRVCDSCYDELNPAEDEEASKPGPLLRQGSLTDSFSGVMRRGSMLIGFGKKEAPEHPTATPKLRRASMIVSSSASADPDAASRLSTVSEASEEDPCSSRGGNPDSPSAQGASAEESAPPSISALSVSEEAPSSATARKAPPPPPPPPKGKSPPANPFKAPPPPPPPPRSAKTAG